MYAIGIDIGGTKCAACLGRAQGDSVTLLHKCPPRPTAGRTPQEMLSLLAADVAECLAQLPAGARAAGVGISCGGPLSSATGRVLSPPNLPGWDDVPVAEFFARETGLPAWLCNDANAGALAEWRFGAGKGCRNLAFLTFGTGLGAGLILDGRLYAGASDLAGEVGHIRLERFGPVGYGKSGSFEGFCSGGGIAQLAVSLLREEWQAGQKPALCPEAGAAGSVTARSVADAARRGDPLALRVMELCGEQLGRGLSVLIDLLNPECIVIGSIFARCRDLLWPAAERVIEAEALPAARRACRVVPAGLSESVGDLAALTVAFYNAGWEETP